ncbi:MAG: radical SAM protein [Clostridia bacterium]|nr:radical SAM protein [Clostridia bacterium]
MVYDEYLSCRLCPRECNVNRNAGEKGFCAQTNLIKAGRAALHFWEEPCICDKNGSGAVFFSGCSLRCTYCQNFKLSRGKQGIELSEEKLADIYLNLQQEGANNINLVTAEHFAPQIRQSILLAREKGLILPVILNSSGYVNEFCLEILRDVIDIYLVDFKYMDEKMSHNYSMAKDYPCVAKKALQKMVEYAPNLIFNEKGLLQKGVIVRHLCLPGHSEDSKNVLEYVYKTYGNNVLLSIMSQYTPVNENKEFPNLNKALSEKEYDEILDFCIDIGIEEAFIQDGEAASESFIPEFNGQGIIY